MAGGRKTYLSGGGEFPPPADEGAAAAAAAARRRRVAARRHRQSVAVVAAGRGRGGLADVDVHGAERGREGVDARQALAAALRDGKEGNLVTSEARQ